MKHNRKRTIVKGFTPPSNNIQPTITPRLQVIDLYQNKPTVIISEKLQQEIDLAHTKVGPIEWCGVLLFKEVSGNIHDGNLVIMADHFHLMDIGSAAHTSASITTETISEMMDKGGVFDMIEDGYKRGLIHTHHNMATFFSGTDMEELQDNTRHYEYYLSLIVNFKGEYTAKIAMIGKPNKEESQVEYTYRFGKVYTSPTKLNDVLLTADCSIQFEQPPCNLVSEYFTNRLTEFVNRPKTYPVYQPFKSNTTIQTNFPVTTIRHLYMDKQGCKELINLEKSNCVEIRLSLVNTPNNRFNLNIKDYLTFVFADSADDLSKELSYILANFNRKNLVKNKNGVTIIKNLFMDYFKNLDDFIDQCLTTAGIQPSIIDNLLGNQQLYSEVVLKVIMASIKMLSKYDYLELVKDYINELKDSNIVDFDISEQTVKNYGVEETQSLIIPSISDFADFHE